MNNTFHDKILADTLSIYPLEWLDRLVTVSLNPENIANVNLEPEKLNEITAHLQEEKAKLQILIKSQFFTLSNDEDFGMVIRRYHSSLALVLEQSEENQKSIPKSKELLSQLFTSIVSCLKNLLTFIEHRFPNYLGIEPVKNSKNHKKLLAVRQKIKCILSTDQMGLIIRGMIESGLIDAPSKSEVFRELVPHLSSPYKDELSADGMRSKSYVAEESDKRISIEALERLIKFIRGY